MNVIAKSNKYGKWLAIVGWVVACGEGVPWGSGSETSDSSNSSDSSPPVRPGDAGGEGPDDSDAGSCCSANGSPGCNGLAIEACVCSEVSACCEIEWTEQCVELVDSLGCGVCGPPPATDGSTSEPGSTQDCCVEGPEPGCMDPEIEACVCADVEFCCETSWQSVCASAVPSLGCGRCEQDPSTGGETSADDTAGDETSVISLGCCEVQPTPGCLDPEIEACVCARDDFCCVEEWDGICVDSVNMLGCGMCEPLPPDPDVLACCMEQPDGVAGCPSPPVQECVCATMPECCELEWNDACGAAVETLECGSCSSP